MMGTMVGANEGLTVVGTLVGANEGLDVAGSCAKYWLGGYGE